MTATKMFFITCFSSFILSKVFPDLRDFERRLRRLSEDFSEAFLESLLMHFMLEDFPRSLQEVF
ncbi:hypothetical protein DY000_02047661 [Brassica cretica]|uniref:Uncharacterized protein n=1 Tax=Brassica cretica TaxID=69181 RepID=A0ABQ7EW53_BRACR|nr:hypothetical protein DY000_02047661 [Brassica cretica]